MEKNLRVHVRKLLDAAKLSPAAAAAKYDELCGFSKSFHRLTENNRAEYFAEEFPWEFAELEGQLLNLAPHDLKTLLSCIRIYGERRAVAGEKRAAGAQEQQNGFTPDISLEQLMRGYTGPAVAVLTSRFEAQIMNDISNALRDLPNLLQ